jgi:DNA-binding PadR family transcriptional regulator
MTKRKVSNPLALAVLACLAERPMHPYEMASTMRERHKDDSIKLNYGSLYSVIESLCRNQFIVAKETEKAGNRPEYTQFQAGLALLPVLSPEEAVKLLTRRCEMLELGLAKERSILDYTRSKDLARLFVIDREYAAMLREAELKWTRALVEEVRSGKLDGMADWRTWHRMAMATAD